MAECDTNNSKKIDFSGKYIFFLNLEFIVAAMAKEKLLSKGKIESAFKMFD